MEIANSPGLDSFSLVKGGPLYRVMLRLGFITGESYVRMAVLFTLLTWLPLYFLSVWQGLAGGDQVRIPFLRDFAVHARFLVAFPLLIVADMFIDPKLRRVVNHFLRSNLIVANELPRFESAVREIVRWRNSVLIEGVILLIAVVHGFLAISKQGWISTGISSWYAMPTAEGWRLTPAGWWFQMSIPVFIFFLYRWLWRLFLWTRFLWRVSKLNLQLVATHPDGAGGLAFVGGGLSYFGFILFAASAVGTGYCANQIVFEGQTLSSLRAQIAVFLLLLTVLFIIPALVMTPKLFHLKKKSLLDYGALAMGYVQSFDAKWLRGDSAQREVLLGSSDIQSLADLPKGYETIHKMHIVPLDRKTALSLLASAVAPFLPLLLTVFPLEELIKHAVKMLL